MKNKKQKPGKTLKKRDWREITRIMQSLGLTDPNALDALVHDARHDQTVTFRR